MPSSSDSIRWNQLPPAIAATLRKAVRRIRAIVWTRGLLATAAAALISILAIMAIDAAYPIYSAGVRWVLTGAGLAATLLVAWRALARPLSRPFTPARVAAILEARHPELEERISTVVELLSSPDASRADLLSGELFGVLSREAEVDAAKVSPRSEFTGRTVKPRLIAFAGAAAVLGVLFAIAPGLVRRLFVRAIAPYAEVDNAFGGFLDVRPGDAVCLLGEPFTIELDAEPGLAGHAYIRRRAIAPDGKVGPEIPERMRSVDTADSPDAESADASDAEPPARPARRRYVQTIPVVTSSFKYRAACGHALTRHYTVTAVEPPGIASLAITLEYPAYTGRELAVFQNTAPDIAAPPGTLATFAATFNREGLASELLIPGVSARSVSTAHDTAAWTAAIDATTDTTWTIALRDENGYTNVPVSRLFRTAPDQPPVIALARPESTRLNLPPHSKIGLQFVASDDFGLATPEIWIRAAADLAGETPDADVPEATMLRPVRVFQPSDEGDVWVGSDSIDLSTLALGNARFLQFELRVADNLPADLGGPHVATSAVVTVELDRDAQSLASQGIDAQARRIEAALQEIADRLADARDASGAVSDRLQEGGALDQDALSSLDDARRDATMARTLSDRLAEELADTPFAPLGERVADFAANTAEAPRARAEEAQLANPAERPAAIESARAAADAAHDEALELLKETKEFADRLRDLERLQELADREKALADAAMALENAEDAETWRSLQEELANQLGKQLSDDTPSDSSDDSALAETLSDMRKAAETAAQLKEEWDQSGDPQQGDPQQGDPQQGDPQQGEPQQGNPQQGDPQQGDPQQGDPQQGDPQQGEPQQGDSQQGEPQQGDPQQGEPQQGDPQKGEALRQAMQQQAQKAAQQLQAQARQEAEEMGVPLPSDAPQDAQSPSMGELLKAMRGDMAQLGHEHATPGTLTGEGADEDWFRIRGTSKSGATGSAVNVPAEYRELVRDYFRALSEGGADN